MPFMYWESRVLTHAASTVMGQVRFGGKPFREYFQAAWRTLFADEIGVLGIASSGSLYPLAKDNVDTHGKYGFTIAQLKKYLLRNEWKFHAGHPLTVDNLSDPDSWGEAPLGGNAIRLNSRKLADRVRDDHGETVESKEILMWLTGSVILHELLHAQGFTHPRLSDDPDIRAAQKRVGSDYRQSFNEIAQRAVHTASPFPHELDAFT